MRKTRLFPALIVFLFLLAACAQAASVTPPTATPAPTATPEPTATPAPTATPEPTATPAIQLSDSERTELMWALYEPSADDSLAALDTMVASGDRQFIPVLIEALRAGQLGIVRVGQNPALVTALETLSGETFGADWGAWVEWYGTTDIQPPPEFTRWKGRYHIFIDPAFAAFFKDEAPATIRVEEIQWGGVMLDGIPALDNVPQVAAAEAKYLLPEEAVFGLSINGDNRAYPLRYMDWHEMANDVVGGVPVSIAYCTLCGAAVAFDGRAPNGETYDFGSSGFLFRSNKLMYDRQTRTLWNQLTGEPVLGELVDADIRLNVLPIVLTTWEDWQKQHPDTTVMSDETGFARDYTPGAAYGHYFIDNDTMFPVWQRSDLLPTKAQIYALRVNELPKAYPIDVLVAEQVTNDALGGVNVVLVTRGDAVEVTGESQIAGTVTYTSGAQVRAYERGAQTFAPGAPGTVVDENGAVWEITEDALIGPNGETLPRLGGHLAYWFGWFAFFPNTDVYEPGE